MRHGRGRAEERVMREERLRRGRERERYGERWGVKTEERRGVTEKEKTDKEVGR